MDGTMGRQVVVARTGAHGLEYLVNRAGGRAWDTRLDGAVSYQTVREATREAMRLPSRLRAFALPALAAS
jgi:hypothetical protein